MKNGCIDTRPHLVSFVLVYLFKRVVKRTPQNQVCLAEKQWCAACLWIDRAKYKPVAMAFHHARICLSDFLRDVVDRHIQGMRKSSICLQEIVRKYDYLANLDSEIAALPINKSRAKFLYQRVGFEGTVIFFGAVEKYSMFKREFDKFASQDVVSLYLTAAGRDERQREFSDAALKHSSSAAARVQGNVTAMIALWRILRGETRSSLCRDVRARLVREKLCMDEALAALFSEVAKSGKNYFA